MPLLIYSQPEEKPDPFSISPNKDKESIQALAVEGKKMDCVNKSIENQLFGNTILACVYNFVDNITEYDEEFIQNVAQLSAYGIAYTGSGKVGFFKLEIKFSYPMKMITKVKLTLRPQPSAASIVDYALDYIIYSSIKYVIIYWSIKYNIIVRTVSSYFSKLYIYNHG